MERGYQLNTGQTFQVFTGAAPDGSSTSAIQGSRTGAAPDGSSTSAIHGSRKTWKVYFGMLIPL